MAYNTKLKLIDAKFEQPIGGELTLSGDTIIASSGELKYAAHPTFTENTQVVDKQYVDEFVASATTEITYDNVWMSGTTDGITLDYWYDKTQSAGRFSGGTITNGSGAGLINIAAGAGLIKETNTDTGVNRYVTWTAVTDLSLQTGYNYVFYDAETNLITATTDEAEIKDNRNFNLGRVYYDNILGLTIIRLCGQNLWNLNRRLHRVGDELFGVQRAEGLVTTSVSGLTFQVSAGVMWAELLNRFTTNAFSSTTTSFREWYNQGGNWQAPIISSGNLNNTQWNDTSTGLVNLTADYYTIRWVYVVHDSSIHVVYDDAEYSGITQAQLATVPAILPDMIRGYATLSARVIVKQGVSSIVEIDSAFVQVFTTTTVGQHNDLGGIQGGAPGEYSHVTNAQITSINDIPNKLNTSTFNSYTGATETRLDNIEEVTDVALTGTTNGLSYTSRVARLGGTLTQDTSILGDDNYLSLGTDASKLSYLYGNVSDCIAFKANQNIELSASTAILIAKTGKNIQIDSTDITIVDTQNSKGAIYGGNYSANFVPRSLVDKGYVTGLTSAIDGEISGLDARLDVIEPIYVTGTTNGLSKDGAHLVKLGGTLSEPTTVLGSQILNINVNELNLTGATGIYLSGATYLTKTPASFAGDVLTYNPSTGEVSKTSLSTLGGITGGTNGIGYFGQDVCLGAPLIKDTEITGAFDLSLGTAGSKLDLLDVNTSGNVEITSDNNLVMSLSGGTIATSDLKGLRYTTDYSDTFVDSSLVTKLYVDTIATGLDPKSAVLVATTTGITLSGTQTIDGVAVVAGDRVLVKNQTSGQTNGIYVVAAGAWSRALDFDGNPEGEVTEGALIPVLTGETNINSSWILVTKNPITVGNTVLTFTKFSQLLDVSAGNGIDIQTAGYTKQINVKLASTSGLEFNGTDLRVDLADNSGLQLLSTGLTVNSAIAGNALDWSAGVIDVNIVDINSQLGGVLSGVTNGLTEYTTGVVGLGGSLCQATDITIIEGTNLRIIDNSTTAKQGIIYGDNYSASFVPRSLVDKGYVTGLTSTIEGDITGLDARLDVIEPIYVTGATNGLSKDGAHNVCLGGTLAADTTIDITGYELGFTAGANFYASFDADGDTIDIGTSTGGVYLDAFSAQLYAGSTNILDIGLTDTTFTSGDGAGIQYLDDYSNTFVNRSLVDKEYVDNAAGSIAADNGLTRDGDTIILGGTLTGDTIVSVANDYVLTITGGSNNTGLVVSGVNEEVWIGNDERSYVMAGYNDIDLYSTEDTNSYNSKIYLNPGSICICAEDIDNTAKTTFNINYLEISVGSTHEDFSGMTYDADYSANFVNRSIPDVGYVNTAIDAATSGITASAITGATNGLTKAGQDVKLGGSLSEVTTIGVSSSSLRVTGATTYSEFDNGSLRFCAGTLNCHQRLELGGCCASLLMWNNLSGATRFSVNCGTFNAEIESQNKVSICGDSGIILHNTTCLDTTPTTGATSDAVLVWNSTDKQIKQIDASNLGEDNNDYSKLVVSAATATLDADSPYLILVDYAGAVTIDLPATPFDGQAVKIKDASGNAVVNNITINRNGKEIDGAASNATINTDGGALELVYDAALNGWFVLSFVN